jgi:hypothetical protein
MRLWIVTATVFLSASLAMAQGRTPGLDLGTGEGGLRIESTTPEGTVQYDEEHNLLYGSERVRITHGERSLEADAIIFDPLTREAQAFGHTILEGPAQRFEAESAWYNFTTDEGLAHNVRGWNNDLYITGAEFRGLSEEELLFRRATSNWDRLDTEEPEWVTPRYTTCDFPEPHIALRAREFDLFPDDRLFARHLIVEVMGVPVFYFPAWTKGLGAGNPWDVRFGYSSLLGAFISIDYNYRHRLYEPDPFTGELRQRSAGHLRAGVDYFTRRGLGTGAEYGYSFEDGAQRGRWQLYHIQDNDRDDDDRWLVQGSHRWQLSDSVVALFGADMVNDPEIYEDFFDDYELDRGRLHSRRIYGALTVTDDDFINRLNVDVRDRLAEDRTVNFSEPSDNNDQFEFDFDGDGDDDIDAAFDDDQWGRVSERVEYTFSTNDLQIGNTPVFYSWDVTLFDNLDAALNRQRTFDDSHVLGVDFYQSLLWSFQLTNRLSLLVRGGLGVLVADRNRDNFNLSGPFPRRVNNVIFASDDSFYVGTDLIGADNLNDFVLDGTEGAFGTELMDLSDVDPVTLYGDILVRLQARLSDALVAWAEWRLREATGQSLGEFYAEAGMPTFLDDLYAFRLEEHWIEAGIRHRLRRPDITSSLVYERNLQGSSRIYQGERTQRLRGNTSWRNAARTVRAALGGSLQETQLRHPSDSREVQITSASTHASVSLTPRHEIWSDTITVSALFPLEDDPYDTFDTKTDDDDLDENDANVSISNLLRVKISPLWHLTWYLRLTDTGQNEDTGGANAHSAVTLERDLHDAVLILGVAAKNESFRGDGNQDENRLDASFAIRFRASSQEPIGVSRPVLVAPRHRTGEIDEGT